ncbi:MAG: Yip1 family protein [Pseudomonadales bacterium]|nr:Yip1 family protein [Pseudomonadales bacterium]
MKHLIGILSRPHSEWARIRDQQASTANHYLAYLIWVALLPPLAWWYGASQIGWELSGRTIRLTSASAAQIMTLFYIAILLSIGFLGYMIHWMARTYDARNDDVSHGIGVAAYMCAPLFVVGLIGLYPILWLDMLLGTAAAAYTLYLLYIGIPIVYDMPKERGFLFASATVAVGLVLMVALLAATVILWEMGAMPVFTD